MVLRASAARAARMAQLGGLQRQGVTSPGITAWRQTKPAGHAQSLEQSQSKGSTVAGALDDGRDDTDAPMGGTLAAALVDPGTTRAGSSLESQPWTRMEHAQTQAITVADESFSKQPPSMASADSRVSRRPRYYRNTLRRHQSSRLGRIESKAFRSSHDCSSKISHGE